MSSLAYQYKARRVFRDRPPLIGSKSREWENYIARLQDERQGILADLRGVHIRGSTRKVRTLVERTRAQADLMLLTADIERATWNYKVHLFFEQNPSKYPPVTLPPPEAAEPLIRIPPDQLGF